MLKVQACFPSYYADDCLPTTTVFAAGDQRDCYRKCWETSPVRNSHSILSCKCDPKQTYNPYLAMSLLADNTTTSMVYLS